MITTIRARFLIAVRTAKYLHTCRDALPRWLVWLLRAAMVLTCLPGVPDLGIDELIYLVAGTVIWFRHRALLRACWRAAQLES